MSLDFLKETFRLTNKPVFFLFQKTVYGITFNRAAVAIQRLFLCYICLLFLNQVVYDNIMCSSSRLISVIKLIEQYRRHDESIRVTLLPSGFRSGTL